MGRHAGQSGPAGSSGTARSLPGRTSWLEGRAPTLFLMPAVLVILFLALFPLITSLYLSLSRIRFAAGSLRIDYVGWANYRKLLLGSEKTHFLGLPGEPSVLGWAIVALVAALLVAAGWRYVTGRRVTAGGLLWRTLAAAVVLAATWLLVLTVGGGRPGTVGTTLIYVFGGTTVQYLLGLGLALLCVQRLPGQRFFRAVFLLPMMITPVGIAYLFRMLTDTGKGPLAPLWHAVGLGQFSWVNHPWGARIAVVIGDTWQWTPFMFIVLLAALESRSQEQIEAAVVDGARPWQVFRYITLPQILPVSATLVLIRLIEAFKLVDLPNVLTNGGPGTASESMTLQAYFAWRTLDMGGSAAIGYVLMVIVTLVCLSYVNLIYRGVSEQR